MKKKKMVWYILFGMNVCLAVLLGAQYTKRWQIQQSIAEKVLRFHVIANSDSAKDQALKLKVRDAVGKEMAEVFADVGSREACEAIAAEKLDEIECIARRVIAAEGYDYEACAFVKEVDFPAKTYGDYIFPAGEYEALEVVIGEGAGQNWWCVMYPNMCFSGSVYEVVDEEAGEALKEVLSEEEYAEVFSEGEYEVRFRYLTFLNELTK